jgi:hypothetical protein
MHNFRKTLTTSGCIGLTILVAGFSNCVLAQTMEKVEVVVTADSSAVRPAAQGEVLQPHSVTLSWTASVPASPSPGDAVTSYNIYRSATIPVLPNPTNRIACSFLSTTSCIDINVMAGQQYFYVATAFAERANNGKGAESKPSSPAVEVRIPIP